MTDRRLRAANARVAAAELRGQVAAERFVEGEYRAVVAPLADLRAAPEGARDRQLLCGDRVRVLEETDGWAFGQAEKDGYVGYLRADTLGPDSAATEFVAVRGTHLYPRPHVKAEATAALSFGARIRKVSEANGFAETESGGFVPVRHLRPVNQPFRDPVTIAQLFFGTPYLWGGNTGAGIDCSGLVQAAFLACGVACPADTDLQAAALGTALPDGTPPARGDLLFWQGHVAFVVDGETLIHANAHHMAVVYEPIEDAIRRIEAQGDGPVTRHSRR